MEQALERGTLLDGISVPAIVPAPWRRLGSGLFRPRGSTRAPESETELTTSVLDALGLPVCVVDPTARLLYVNAPGRRLLRQGEVLARLTDGQLRACGARCDAALRRAIGDAVQGRTGGARLLDRDGETAFHVAALGLGAKRAAGSGPCAARVLLVMTATATRRAPAVGLLQRMFALTNAETSLALALARGVSIEEYAEQSHRSLATIRTQMRSLYARTGAKRLGDLLLLLGRLPAVEN